MNALLNLDNARAAATPRDGAVQAALDGAPQQALLGQPAPAQATPAGAFADWLADSAAQPEASTDTAAALAATLEQDLTPARAVGTSQAEAAGDGDDQTAGEASAPSLPTLAALPLLAAWPAMATPPVRLSQAAGDAAIPVSSTVGAVLDVAEASPAVLSLLAGAPTAPPPAARDEFAAPGQVLAEPAAAPLPSPAAALAGLADLTTVAAAAAPGADASLPATLKLPAAPEGRAWQQPLLQALGDRLQLQIAARSEQAQLHLEPPQLGRIEIAIRQQGGALQVRLSATHDEVAQQLRQISEPLRQDLVQRHSGEVSVQVGSASVASDGRGRDGTGQGGTSGGGAGEQAREGRRQTPGQALADEGADAPQDEFAGRLYQAGQG